MNVIRVVSIQATLLGLLCAASLQVRNATPCPAQDVAVELQTSVSVEGRVANLFQSDSESLVQLLVQKSELSRIDRAGYAPYPAPGQYVYVHVLPDNTLRGRLAGQSGDAGLPRVQSLIRARLKLDRSGQWSPDGEGWFQSVDAVVVGATPLPVEVDLGVTTERINLGRASGLKVMQVDPESPAGRAGIEPGDVIVQANREPVDSESQLLELYRRARGEFSLTVRDVRSGRDVSVPVETAGDRPVVTAPGRQRPLGATTKLAFYGGENALEVTGVEPGSPASAAGIVPGMLIVEAGGKSLDGPDALDGAASASGGRLELKVVNPPDRQVRTIRVDLR